MALSASELVEAGLALPASQRRDVALRLLESMGGVDDDVIDGAWTEEIASRVDDLASGRVTALPAEQVLSRIDARLDALQAPRDT